jgi:ferredoxin
VIVDPDLCESNGVCVDLAPDVFALTADERLAILASEPPAARRAAVEEAVRACPRLALEIVDGSPAP